MKSAWFARLPFTVHAYPLYYRNFCHTSSTLIIDFFFSSHNAINISILYYYIQYDNYYHMPLPTTAKYWGIHLKSTRWKEGLIIETVCTVYVARAVQCYRVIPPLHGLGSATLLFSLFAVRSNPCSQMSLSVESSKVPGCISYFFFFALFLPLSLSVQKDTWKYWKYIFTLISIQNLNIIISEDPWYNTTGSGLENTASY